MNLCMGKRKFVGMGEIGKERKRERGEEREIDLKYPSEILHI